jgi:hypothetical protein
VKIVDSPYPDALIGRLPWVHVSRPPRRGFRAKLDTGIDKFWFALTFLIWVITPIIGAFWIVAGRA